MGWETHIDASYRLRYPYATFRAAALLGEALVALDQPERGPRRFREVHAMILRLIDTLPELCARLFLDQHHVRVGREHASRERRVPALSNAP